MKIDKKGEFSPVEGLTHFYNNYHNKEALEKAWSTFFGIKVFKKTLKSGDESLQVKNTKKQKAAVFETNIEIYEKNISGDSWNVGKNKYSTSSFQLLIDYINSAMIEIKPENEGTYEKQLKDSIIGREDSDNYVLDISPPKKDYQKTDIFVEKKDILQSLLDFVDFLFSQKKVFNYVVKAASTSTNTMDSEKVMAMFFNKKQIMKQMTDMNSGKYIPAQAEMLKQQIANDKRKDNKKIDTMKINKNMIDYVISKKNRKKEWYKIYSALTLSTSAESYGIVKPTPPDKDGGDFIILNVTKYASVGKAKYSIKTDVLFDIGQLSGEQSEKEFTFKFVGKLNLSIKKEEYAAIESGHLTTIGEDNKKLFLSKTNPIRQAVVANFIKTFGRPPSGRKIVIDDARTRIATYSEKKVNQKDNNENGMFASGELKMSDFMSSSYFTNLSEDEQYYFLSNIFGGEAERFVSSGIAHSDWVANSFYVLDDLGEDYGIKKMINSMTIIPSPEKAKHKFFDFFKEKFIAKAKKSLSKMYITYSAGFILDSDSIEDSDWVDKYSGIKSKMPSKIIKDVKAIIQDAQEKQLSKKERRKALKKAISINILSKTIVESDTIEGLGSNEKLISDRILKNLEDTRYAKVKVDGKVWRLYYIGNATVVAKKP